MKIKLRLGTEREYREVVIIDKKVTLKDIADEYQSQNEYRFLMAQVNGQDRELSEEINEGDRVELLDMRTPSANRAYQNTVSFIYLKAIKDLFRNSKVIIENSLSKGLYTEVNINSAVTEEQVRQIEDRMRQIVEEDIPIIKEIYTKGDAIRIWEEDNSPEKASLLEHCRIKEAQFYNMDGYRNFFYGHMVPSTGYIEYFEVVKHKSGVILRFPYPTKPDEIPVFEDQKNLYNAFGEAKKWQELLGVSYVDDLNRKIKEGYAKDLILLSEALHEKKIAEIADMITSGKKRIVLIAGPSSSGKTTFARRLSVQLRVNGVEPLYLGTDDYFVEREDTPLGPDGKPNYEDLEALDIELFNDHMNRLLNGEEVDLPEFDFIDGKKVYGKRILSIEPDQPIVIEGIHALNGKLTEFIDEDEKFKIYISPLTQLNIDVHNRIPTTDARMLRRIVRDYKYRGHSAAETIAQWPKVRAGEDKNIFPYSGEADVLFNSALIYELSVLSKYATPLLQEVAPSQPEYSEAARMLQFIRYFDVIEEDRFVPNNSIMREFIGGSIFVE